MTFSTWVKIYDKLGLWIKARRMARHDICQGVALSTAKAEYIFVDSCCAQILWMKQQLSDYGILLDHIPIKCDNTSAINLSKNPVQHSRTKHIEIRLHFLRDHVLKGDRVLEFVDTKNQLADIFTKPLPKENFFAIRRELGLIDIKKLDS